MSATIELTLAADGAPEIQVYAAGRLHRVTVRDLVDRAAERADADHPRMRAMDLEALADGLGRDAAHLLERSAGVGPGTRAEGVES
jgi:hypothetical protein